MLFAVVNTVQPEDGGIGAARATLEGFLTNAVQVVIGPRGREVCDGLVEIVLP